jgi:tetratricopeptide (TPR) repeat protein
MQKLSLNELEKKAIEAALDSRWTEALKINQEIHALDSHNIPSLLRGGFAAFQLKKFDIAHDLYKKVLKHQPQSIIALEYVEKIAINKESASTHEVKHLQLDPDLFVELPGKTKAVVINQLGQRNILAKLIVGEKVNLIIRKRHVEVRNENDEYIGILPDDVGVRLIYFIEHESVYSAYIREANLSRISIFIREQSKGKKVERMASFPLDIPGSIARVMAQQTEELEAEQVEKPKTTETPDGLDVATVDPDEKSDIIEDSVIADLETEDKNGEEPIMGIETDEDKEEEE